ncbi:antitrypsin-like isoform X2 [Anopheles aquasalis]|uniref:antitrypsin-like isoform X2 n=1 Tax=Anopheles aquasalis TaxID=42839 RepID=UPI00215A4FEE|nr:antitrypsin-like isoform X2 [Anopheles aquasalis]
MGADGETADEIFRVLRYGKADRRQQVAESYGQLMKLLESDKSISVANKVYVKAGYEVKPSFNEVAINSFRSEAEEINFTDNKAAAQTINDWVESKTNQKIKNVISPSVLDSLTGMVLINVVNFMESREIAMMSIKKFFDYKNFADKGFSALELPYSGNGSSMLVLLPNDRIGLAALEEQLSSLDLAEVISQMGTVEVQVFLPKFKFEFSLDVQAELNALGMKRMFSDSARFPDLLDANETLKVSRVAHKAFIEVDEKGTKAAAVTYVIMLTSSVISLIPVIEFRADHPFVYVLLSREKSVYFIGKISNPE